MPVRPNTAVVNRTEIMNPGKKMKSNKKDKTNTEKVVVYEPGIPEPTNRAELMKYWINLSLDDKTANKMLWIADSGLMVRRRTEEICPVLDRPERYENCPQVLCKEGLLNVRAYWEVEYTGWVVIGATYEGAGRRGNSGPSGLGDNEESWGLCWLGSCYQIWFNGINTDITNVPFCPTIGVYIDQPAGIINFYTITGEGAEREAMLLYKVKTTIEKKIVPGFWMGVQSTCTMLRKTD
ncbi:tripartite motif-containing protein 16-like [Limanda limanda]|uniref:tripartite motif-containing protein 16-like n=1 Tax=Limanda limanda TaxID=27771 RepID=UPI0029C917E2|nr:tripartite motif-containing protein 16-like [Limanda limanda]